jgi:uncharacterized phage protein gp47/JayE
MRFKRMSEIYSRLVDHTITSTNEINDFSVGSAMRAIYESVSIELEQFYILTRENIQEAIEQGVYSSFGFTRTAALKSYGKVRVSFHNATQQDRVISRGSRFSSSLTNHNQVYETMQEYVIPKGTISLEVEVYCTVSGVIGNIPANTINVMHTPIANVREVKNNSAFQTGQDSEPLEELRARFNSFIESLSKATIPALEYGTRSVNNVSGVYIEEETGRITIYAHDRNGNLPSLVKTEIESSIFRYRPAGIPVLVKPVTRKDVDVAATVTLTDKTAITTRFKTQIETEISRYLNNLKTSKSLILSDLSRVIMNIDKQYIYDVNFTSLEGNVIIEGSEIIRAGNVMVTLQ